MKTQLLLVMVMLVALVAGTTSSSAQDITCTVPMTAQAAGTNSPATGSFQFIGFENPLSIAVTVTHNVASATSIEIRAGAVGQTGALITNLGGATASPANYTLDNTEANALLAAGIDWYVIVSSAGFPSPGGAIRVNGLTCLSSNPTEGEGGTDGEGSMEAEVLPEGLGDYMCSISLNGAQVVPASGTGATASATIEFDGPNSAALRLQVALASEGTAYIYSGSPGENGEQIRRLGNVGPAIPFLIASFTAAEWEDYSSTPHYFEIDAGAQTIRGDIVGCEFDDGVEDPEGEGEGIGNEGEGEGQVVDCLVFTDPNPVNLICAETLSGSQVVPPTTSSFQGSLQLTGPLDPGNQYALVVRHNVPAPTSIGLYLGSPGQAGTLFLGFNTNLTCPFVTLLPSNFLQVLNENPMYVEIVDAGDANATLRADLPCGVAPEGEGADGEGSPTEGEGEGQVVNDLAGIADFLLLTFPVIDVSPKNGRLNTSEATGSVPTLTGEQFTTLDTDGNGGLTPGELHRFAGPVRLHNADVNGDKTITLSELLRVVALFNAAGYSCVDPAGSTEDGFQPVLTKDEAGKGGSLPCLRHAADYNGGGDFEIDLSELLRAIQLFYFDTYSYSCPNSDDDDYCTEFEAAE